MAIGAEVLRLSKTLPLTRAVTYRPRFDRPFKRHIQPTLTASVAFAGAV